MNRDDMNLERGLFRVLTEAVAWLSYRGEACECRWMEGTLTDTPRCHVRQLGLLVYFLFSASCECKSRSFIW